MTTKPSPGEGLLGEDGTHFWFMSINGKTRWCWARGTVTPRPSETRVQLFDRCQAWLVSQNPDITDGQVIAFDIQPNTL